MGRTLFDGKVDSCSGFAGVDGVAVDCIDSEMKGGLGGANDVLLEVKFVLFLGWAGWVGVVMIDDLVYFDGLAKIKHCGQANLRFIM